MIRKITLYLTAVVLLLFIFSNCLAKESGKDGPLCPFCKNTGRLKNPLYESSIELEGKVLFCSHSIENDPKGFGLDWLPCVKCRNAQVKAKAIKKFEKEVEVVKAWLKERREVDEYCKVRTPLVHIQTKHFLWCWDLPKIRINRKILNCHEGLHLFAQWLEIYYSEFQKALNITDKDNINNFHRFYIFRKCPAAHKATGKYAQQSAPGGKMIKVDKPSAYVTWMDKSKTPEFEDFFCDLIHHATHFFTASYRTGYWSHPTGAIYEGMAHWWEIFWCGQCVTYCRTENHMIGNWINDGWRERALKLTFYPKRPSLVDVLQTNGGSMNANEHILGWSYIDYMIHKDPRKTLDFIANLKEKQPHGEAFQDIWGCSILAFEEQWVNYVKTNYVLKDDSKPFIKSMKVK